MLIFTLLSIRVDIQRQFHRRLRQFVLRIRCWLTDTNMCSHLCRCITGQEGEETEQGTLTILLGVPRSLRVIGSGAELAKYLSTE